MEAVGARGGRGETGRRINTRRCNRRRKQAVRLFGENNWKRRFLSFSFPFPAASAVDAVGSYNRFWRRLTLRPRNAVAIPPIASLGRWSVVPNICVMPRGRPPVLINAWNGRLGRERRDGAYNRRVLARGQHNVAVSVNMNVDLMFCLLLLLFLCAKKINYIVARYSKRNNPLSYN